MAEQPRRDEEQERKFGSSFFESESDKLARALREAQPAWLRDGHGIRGPHALARLPSPDVHRRSDHPDGSVVRQPVPVSETRTATSTEQVAATSIPDISFYASDASDADTKRVLINDGKVTWGGVSTFPDGMGGGDFILDIDDPTDALIYVLATFDPETLLKTSITVAVDRAADVPESRVDEEGGFLVFLLAYTFIDADGAFRVWNRRLGDISFEFTYAAMNGQPALLPVFTDLGYLDLASLFPPP